VNGYISILLKDYGIVDIEKKVIYNKIVKNFVLERCK